VSWIRSRILKLKDHYESYDQSHKKAMLKNIELKEKKIKGLK